MRIFVYISLITLLACKGGKDVHVQNMPTETPAPTWVQQRPITGAYYTGIGVANKSAVDHMDVAKKNALNDLASEISVNVEGNSLLYTLDRRYSFEEEFSSTIRSSTSEQLEQFELVDSWSDDQVYWVYYRLDKRLHAQLKAERKTKAIETAKAMIMSGEDALKNGMIRDAFRAHMRALLAIKEYWNEDDRTMLGDREVFLGEYIHSRLQTLASGVQMNALPAFAKLELANDFAASVRLMPQLLEQGTAIGLKQLPLLIEVPRREFMHRQRKSTGQDGLLYFDISDIPANGKQEAAISVDIAELVGTDMRDPLVRPLISTLTAVTYNLPIELELPTIYMEQTERNMGKPLGELPGIASVLQQELTKNGFKFTTRKENADLYVVLKSSTRKGNVMRDFHTAYLDLEVVFEKSKDGDIIHHAVEDHIKGVQLTWRKAGEAAFRKGAEEMKKRIVPAMIDSLL